MFDRMQDGLEWIGDTAADICGCSEKESGVLVAILAIVLTCLLALSLVFGLFAWMLGINFWWFWAGAVIGYLIVVVYMHVMINIRSRRK